ncbi:hypothetical protein Hypma_010277 [Hypsizygus marmoreus]|uniref:Uncharacterized protein n=1 Tax=Hypsizygus marmoreus TaxID=39966 RepID=A0A369JSW8_HYPMA|nr:hypothetical protein Hypma_010277 [Hypsizygus marmoreus]
MAAVQNNVAIVPLSTDISHSSVVVRTVREGHWTSEHGLLDLSVNNWSSWSKHVEGILQMSGGLDRYLHGKTAEPDSALEPRANENWQINDAAVCAFLRSKCAPAELSIIEDSKSSLATWTTLLSRHKLQGPISQVSLIQEALNVRYSTSTPFAETTAHIRSLNKRIWDMGTPTVDSFLVILMLIALSPDELRNVRDSIINGISSSNAAAPYTATNIVSRLELEQQVRSAEAARLNPVPNEAHPAFSKSSRDTKSRDPKSRDVCSHCGGERHQAEFCIQPGGNMAGQTIADARAAKFAKRALKNKPKESALPSSAVPKPSKDSTSSPSIIHDANNRAYIVDSTTGNAYPLHAFPSTASEAHFSR